MKANGNTGLKGRKPFPITQRTRGGRVMRAIQNSFTNPVRPLAAGTWLALFSVLTLCLFAPVANDGSAPALPIVVTGAAVQGGALTGGWNGSQSPLSGTFAIGANGNVYVGNGWGSNTLEMVPGGATTAILPIAGSAGAACPSRPAARCTLATMEMASSLSPTHNPDRM